MCCVQLKKQGLALFIPSFNLLRCKRVVYASTSGTIGCSPSQQVIGDDAPYCLDVVKNWPYYAGKIESEIKYNP